MDRKEEGRQIRTVSSIKMMLKLDVHGNVQNRRTRALWDTTEQELHLPSKHCVCPVSDLLSLPTALKECLLA